MLLAGPEVVAEDKGPPAGAAAYAGGGGGAPDGKQVFTANCGSCHTLEKAGTSGSVGPNLGHVGVAAAVAACRPSRASSPTPRSRRSPRTSAVRKTAGP